MKGDGRISLCEGEKFGGLVGDTIICCCGFDDGCSVMGTSTKAWEYWSETTPTTGKKERSEMKDIVDEGTMKVVVNGNRNIVSEYRSKYRFQGDAQYLYLFDALLLFYDDELCGKVGLRLTELVRLKNAYFWYSRYIVALKKQGIGTGDHEQVQFKIIEQIDQLGVEVDWSFLQEIEDLKH